MPSSKCKLYGLTRIGVIETILFDRSLTFRSETRMLSCTTGCWEWPFLGQQPAWLTLMAPTCKEEKWTCARTHTLCYRVAWLELWRWECVHPLLLKVYSQCRRRSGSAGGAGGGWLLHCSHALQWPQRSKWRRSYPNSWRTPALRDEDRHTSSTSPDNRSRDFIARY